ncbi:DUF1127 domain-containing protein [Gynuella sunshinyii]|uniref:DUF1127 domain-containing protein n=1 Tax=Gynuella sunshinyii TaxID=1445505 RepID=UPI00069A0CC9
MNNKGVLIRSWEDQSLATKWLQWLRPAALHHSWSIWRQNAQTRRQLRLLPEHLYRDIGLTNHEVRQESNKWFWQ